MAFSVIVYAILFLFGTSSVSAVSLYRYKKTQKAIKSGPNGLPQPPPGMSRNELKRAAQEKLGMNVTQHFNFGFCGGSGAGKSTLINALLNREDVDFVEGKPHNIFTSAPTGFWQTTLTTLCYAYPNGHDFQYVRLWDTAGCGTHEHPSTNYFEEKALYAFDVLIVVAEKELGEYEYTILENAQKHGTPAVVVITKAEEKVESKIRKLFNTRNPPVEEYRKIVRKITDEARQHVSACLERKGLQNISTFIVSAWKYRDLMMDLESTMNNEHQEAILNQEVCADELVGQEVFDQDINNYIFRDHETGVQATAEREARTKNALLSFEICQLLQFIAETAVYRRL